MVDPRWLEIVRASGWQLLALSIALGGFWTLIYFEFLPKIDSPIIVYGLPFAILVTGALGVVSAVEKMVGVIVAKLVARRKRKNNLLAILNKQKEFSDYLPFLTETEHKILSYLFQNKRKTFSATIDADLAATLYSRGFIVLLARPGQQVSMNSATFGIPDHLWSVLEEHAHLFQEPVQLGYRGALPWHSGF